MSVNTGKLKELLNYSIAVQTRGKWALKLVPQNLPSRKGKGRDYCVLDVASGTGAFLAGLLHPIIPSLKNRIDDSRNIFVYRVDVKEETLYGRHIGGNFFKRYYRGDFFKKYKIKGDPRIKTKNVLASATKIKSSLAPGTGTVDLMLFCNALEHFNKADRKNALLEANRLLAKDGILLVIGPISSPLERAEYLAMKASNRLPRGPVDMSLAGDLMPDVLQYVKPEPSSKKYYFVLGAEARIKKEVKDPEISGGLLQLFKNTPNVVDSRSDPDHKIWFSPTSLKSLLSSAGFKVCEGGEDYFISGATHGVEEAERGIKRQSVMPFAKRKAIAHAQIYVCRKK